MDRIGTEAWVEQDEELYALLEKAMSSEPRLTVSEELIQKTLKRVEETSGESGLKEKSYQKFYRPLRYACVAAAAVLVVVVGVKTIGNGRFSANDNAMEAELAPDAAMRNGSVDGTMSIAEYSTAEEAENFGLAAGEIGISYSYVLRSVSDFADDSATVTEEFEAPESVSEGMMDSVTEPSVSYERVEPEATVTISKVEERYGEALEVVLSEEFVTCLEQYGAAGAETEAVYWSFAEAYATDWENIVLEKLVADDVQTEGTMPQFSVRNALMSEQPLHFAVQVQTTSGEIWFVMGEELYLLRK